MFIFILFLFNFIKLSLLKNKFPELTESQNHSFAGCLIPCYTGIGCLQITFDTRDILKIFKDNCDWKGEGNLYDLCMRSGPFTTIILCSFFHLTM